MMMVVPHPNFVENSIRKVFARQQENLPPAVLSMIIAKGDGAVVETLFAGPTSPATRILRELISASSFMIVVMVLPNHQFSVSPTELPSLLALLSDSGGGTMELMSTKENVLLSLELLLRHNGPSGVMPVGVMSAPRLISPKELFCLTGDTMRSMSDEKEQPTLGRSAILIIFPTQPSRVQAARYLLRKEVVSLTLMPMTEPPELMNGKSELVTK